MSSLAEHIANLRAYKSVCAKWVESDSLDKGSIEHFYADQFRSEAGGTFWRHLEEFAALLPDQEELARETAKSAKEVQTAMPVLRASAAAFDANGNSPAAALIAGLLEIFETRGK